MLKQLLVVLALPLTLAAQDAAKPDAASKPAGATEVKVGSGIEGKDLTGAADQFKVAANTRLYVWAKVSGVAADGKVTLAFFKGGKEAYRRELTVAGSPYRLNAYRTFRAGDAGDWTAKALGPDGAELASASFKVEIEK